MKESAAPYEYAVNSHSLALKTLRFMTGRCETMAMADRDEPEWIPIGRASRTAEMQEGETFHWMDGRYPDPPIASSINGTIIHRAEIRDITGLPQLLDWAAEGDISIVNTRHLMSRKTEFNAVIEELAEFVERDLGGEIIQIGDSRILILPKGVRATQSADERR